MDIIKRFENGINRLGIDAVLRSADNVVVAYSGGADSGLLLYLMNEIALTYNVKVYAAHVNHMIRGADADSDEEHCKRTTEKLNIPLFVKRVDVPKFAKENSLGIEEAARNVRYGFFNEVCEKLAGNTVVATAHNADDNLETVIFNMMRGAGIKGVCGIPPIRDGKFIRPMLVFGGEEIRKYCTELRIEYVVDSTNVDTEYSRNYIRNELAPKLKRLNPYPQYAALRMTESLREDMEYLDKQADLLLEETISDNVLLLEKLRTTDKPILKRVIIKYHKLFYSLPSLEKYHIESIISLIKRGGSFELSVPGGCKFKSDGITAVISSNDIETRIPTIEEKEIQINEPIKLENDSYILLSDESYSDDFKIDENIYKLSIHKAVTFDKIKGKLFVRARQEGDIFRIGNMTKKVKKLFNEKKIPIELRVSIPIICDEEGIVWIPGFPLRDGVASKGNSKYSLRYFERDCKNVWKE